MDGYRSGINWMGLIAVCAMQSSVVNAEEVVDTTVRPIQHPLTRGTVPRTNNGWSMPHDDFDDV